jgi:hypothetical protein
VRSGLFWSGLAMQSAQELALLDAPRSQACKIARQTEALVASLLVLVGLLLLYEVLTWTFFEQVVGLPPPPPAALSAGELIAAALCLLGAVLKIGVAWSAVSGPAAGGESDRLLRRLTDRQAQLLGLAQSEGSSTTEQAALTTPELLRTSSALRYRTQYSAKGLAPKTTPSGSSGGKIWGGEAGQMSTTRRRSLHVSPAEVSTMVDAYTQALLSGGNEGGGDSWEVQQRGVPQLHQQMQPPPSQQQALPSLAYAAYDGSMQQQQLLLWSSHVETQDPFRAEAHQLLSRLDIVRSMDDYTDNTRKFLGQRLRRYVSRLLWVIGELEKRGVMRELLQHERSRQPQFRIPGNPQRMLNLSLKDIIYRCLERGGNDFWAHDPESGQPLNLLLAYQDLERVLRVSGEPAYVLHRLRTLSDDGYLGSFRWDSGGRHHGKDWTPELPTDADIVMHVFCCWGDELLPRSHADDQPFVQRHFFEGDESALDSLAGRFMLVRTNPHAHPPHFRVVANGDKWHVARGRLNVFQAVALFLYAVRDLKSGYLQNINLNHVLEDIFTDYSD